MIEQLGAVAALGLDTHAVFARRPMSTDAFAGFLFAIRANRLSGLACAAVETGNLRLTEAQFSALAALDLEVQSQVVRIEHSLLSVSAALDQADIESRVLKGSAFAHRFWASPELRPFVDFDLLVRGPDMDRAVGICLELGATRRLPELRNGFDRRFGKGVDLVGPAGHEWDLHRTLALGPFGFVIDVDDLWTGGDTFDLVGRRLPMPTPEVCFVHACLHASVTGAQRLLSLRDIVQIADYVDFGRAATLAARWSASAAVLSAMQDAIERLDLTNSLLKDHLSAFEPSSREVRLFDVYAKGGVDPSRLALAAWRHVPGIRQKAAYARALVMPDRTNRLARRRTRTDQLRDLARRLR